MDGDAPDFLVPNRTQESAAHGRVFKTISLERTNYTGNFPQHTHNGTCRIAFGFNGNERVRLPCFLCLASTINDVRRNFEGIRDSADSNPFSNLNRNSPALVDRARQFSCPGRIAIVSGPWRAKFIEIDSGTVVASEEKNRSATTGTFRWPNSGVAPWAVRWFIHAVLFGKSFVGIVRGENPYTCCVKIIARQPLVCLPGKSSNFLNKPQKSFYKFLQPSGNTSSAFLQAGFSSVGWFMQSS